MKGVRITVAQSNDADAIRKVIKAAYAVWSVSLPDLPDVAGGVDEDIAAGRVWIAVEKEVIVGCLIGGMVSGRWHLANIAVSPDQGGRGVGKALMAFALVEAARLDAAEMTLATHRKMLGVIALYKRLGWEVSGEDGNKIMMRRSTHE